MLINSQPQFYPISIPPLNGDFFNKNHHLSPRFSARRANGGGTPQRDSELISGYYRASVARFPEFSIFARYGFHV